MEGGAYLHFGIVNMVTIVLMAVIGFWILNGAITLWRNKQGS